MIYIYILELYNNKFYIGKVNNISSIVNDICNNKFEWLFYNKPLKIIDIYNFSNDINEDEFVLEFMNIYGVNNVRGGCFKQMNLTFDNTYDIFKTIKIVYNKCYLCGEETHNGDKCKLNKKYDYDLLVGLITSNIICYKCNNKGHYKEECSYIISTIGTKS
jgi:hypothetical protein